MTGQLQEVMRESVQTAVAYIRSRAELFKIPPDFFEKHDVHIHVPEGAVPKDGPSAGVTSCHGHRVGADGAEGAQGRCHDR